MRFGKHSLMAAAFVISAGLCFTAGNLRAQDQPTTDPSAIQWSSWVTPKIGNDEQGFSFRSSCTALDRNSATWSFEIQNNQPDDYFISSKNTQLGTVEPGNVLDVTFPSSNCKKQPELTATQQVASDDDSGIWTIYQYKDGKAKGKIHDSNDPGWLGIMATVAAAAAAQQ